MNSKPGPLPVIPMLKKNGTTVHSVVQVRYVKVILEIVLSSALQIESIIMFVVILKL